MALTSSNMMPLGTKAPDFVLMDVISGKEIRLSSLKPSKAKVIMFICNHCPFVKHIQQEIVNIAKEYQPAGIMFIAINSNDVENYPDDSPENMKIIAEEFGYPFPFLYDESQEIARAYDAACTPDFYVFDDNLRCVYRGQLDDSRPGNGIPITGRDLRQTLDNILAGKPVSSEQKPSIGCNIKWKDS